MSGRFTFATRKEGFDTHINHSIKNYEAMTDDVVAMSQYFIEDKTFYLDIGCSSGKLVERIANKCQTFAPEATFSGVENESAFFEELRKKNRIVTGGQTIRMVTVDIFDYEFPKIPMTYCTSIFTLQFLPRYKRKIVLERIYDNLVIGGGFVLAEKTFAENSKIQDMMTFLYYDFKNKTFTEKDIMDKERELRHMLKPVQEVDIYDELIEVGFKPQNIECFWKSYLFGAWVAVK